MISRAAFLPASAVAIIVALAENLRRDRFTS